MNLPFHVLLYRYLFFAWLFADASRPMNRFERSAALRHNRVQSRWLPLYMLRYAIFGAGLFGVGLIVESLSPILSAFLYVPATVAVPMLAITGMAWVGLHAT